jgi:hypothetical protein
MARNIRFTSWFEIELISTTNTIAADPTLLNVAIPYATITAATGFSSMLLRVSSCVFAREFTGEVQQTFGLAHVSTRRWTGKFNVQCMPFSLLYTAYWSNEMRGEIERFLARKNLYIRVRPSGTVGGQTVTKAYPIGYDNVFTFSDFGDTTYLNDDQFCYPVVLETTTSGENADDGWREFGFTLVLRSKLPKL